jgi:hypothetical protein
MVAILRLLFVTGIVRTAIAAAFFMAFFLAGL